MDPLPRIEPRSQQLKLHGKTLFGGTLVVRFDITEPLGFVQHA